MNSVNSSEQLAPKGMILAFASWSAGQRGGQLVKGGHAQAGLRADRVERASGAEARFGAIRTGSVAASQVRHLLLAAVTTRRFD
jgi:hypothetical protein